MKDDNVALLKQLSEDRALASAMIFPHRHRQQTPPMHIQIMDMWRSADEFVCIEAFREGGKSTISEEFLTIEALFENFRYGLIFGETYTKAVQRLEAIKHELNTNQKIYALFGKCGKQQCQRWAENVIVLPNGVCLEAHGWEEEIRGYKYLDARPDRAYLDDIENKSMVRDTASVDHNWRKLHMELIPAMDSELGKVRMTGTPLADDCMITRARRSENWLSAQFPICSDDIDSDDCIPTWPQRYPMEWIRKRRNMMATEGHLSEFEQEYMLKPAGAVGKPFTEDMLVYDEFGPTMYAPRKMIIDPARTTDIKKSDQTGHVAVSRIGTKIYVWESEGQFLQPDGVIDLAFSGSERNDGAEVDIEQNSLNDWLLQPIRARMLDTGEMITVKPMNAPQDRNKDQFIMGLQPFLIAGDIVFVGGKQKHKTLIAQILNFPSGRKDVLNALAYAPRVFSGTPIYSDFGQRNIADNYVSPRGSVLLLGANATGSETTAVLCCLDGQYLTVIADWVSPLVPADCIKNITMLIRATHPGCHITAWVPADVFDQVGRNPLCAALRAEGLKPYRGENAVMSRSSLSDMIRTEMRGRRLFCVDNNARHTMQALASGYNWPSKAGGERGGEPERGPARTLAEGLECLTTALLRKDNAPKPVANAVNANGVAYFSALPGRN